jgi:hypothetical protein
MLLRPIQGYEGGGAFRAIGLKPYPQLFIPFRNVPRCGLYAFICYFLSFQSNNSQIRIILIIN